MRGNHLIQPMLVDSAVPYPSHAILVAEFYARGAEGAQKFQVGKRCNVKREAKALDAERFLDLLVPRCR